VEQVEVSSRHDDLGKLLPLQPVLKGHHHRAGLRTVRQALLLEENSAPAYTWGAALVFGDFTAGWVPGSSQGFPAYSFRAAGSLKNKQIDNE
jgi:hypothetical protein